MRALVVAEPGLGGTVAVADLTPPRAGAGQVVVKVDYASVNFADLLAVRGRYPYAGAPPLIPGVEAVGTVYETGPGGAFSVGQPVAAFVGSRGWAQYAVADAHLVCPIPPEAAAPEQIAAGLTVVATVELAACQARLAPGEGVLVHGATGGIGSVAATVLRAHGAGLVVATSRDPARVAAAGGFGYDKIVVTDGFEHAVRELTGGRGVDVVINGVGGQVRARSFAAMARFGRLVAIGNSSFSDESSPTGVALRGANVGISGASLGALSTTDPASVTPFLRAALDRLAANMLDFPVEVVTAAKAGGVLDRLEHDHPLGKLVLDLRAVF